MRIFLDLDGVLADFAGEVFRLFGRSLDESAYPGGEWEIATVLGVTPGDMWAKIEIAELTDGFWEILKPYPWLDELVSLALSHDERFIVSTSPSLSPRCPSEKAHWLRQHLSVGPDRYMMGSAKHHLAGTDAVLIDDSDRNVERWREAGGCAVLFPQPWNANHGLTGDRVGYVRDHLEAISQAMTKTGAH